MNPSNIYSIEQRLLINEREVDKLNERISQLYKDFGKEIQAIKTLYNYAKAWSKEMYDNGISDGTNTQMFVDSIEQFVHIYEELF